jgi:signal transduction histidine kinase
MIRKTVNSVSQQAVDAGVNLHLVSENEISIIYADEHKLKRILVNVLSNAIKFSARGHDVYFNIRSNDAKSHVVFEIKDNGIGMTEEDIQKIFQPFIQVDSKLSRKYEGTGLGLFIARKFCDCMGGDLQLKSKIGMGTIVCIAIPILN